MGICCPTRFEFRPITLTRNPKDDPPHKDPEFKTYDEVQELLKKCWDVRESINQYKGCQELARAAMSKPSAETEKAAFEGLLKAVESIRMFFDFSRELEKIFPKLMNALAEAIEVDHVCYLEEKPALTNQLATIFDFALQFDRVRMLRPNLSNDFSYYRRLLPKFNKHQDIKVKDDEASGMALFTAEHIPMTTCLAKSGAKAQEMAILKSGSDAEGKIGNVLATMANSCLYLLKDDYDNLTDDNRNFIARAMTGSVVIYDHVDHLGSFHRRTPISIKAIITMLKTKFQTELSLVNAIRYSTKNFRDAPDAIQSMFD